MSERFVIPRTGGPPLAFEGELLAESNGRWFRSRGQNRYHDVRVYRTDAGAYVAHVEYNSHWLGEGGWSDAGVFATPEAVAAFLQAVDPTARVVGYPDHTSYHARQVRLIADLEARYAHQVSEALADPLFHEAAALPVPFVADGRD